MRSCASGDPELGKSISSQPTLAGHHKSGVYQQGESNDGNSSSRSLHLEPLQFSTVLSLPSIRAGVLADTPPGARFAAGPTTVTGRLLVG